MKDNILMFILPFLIGFWGFMLSVSVLRQINAGKNILKKRLDEIEKKNKSKQNQISYDEFTRSNEFQFKIFEEYLKGKKLTDFVKKQLLVSGFNYKIDSFLILCTICTIPPIVIITFIDIRFFVLGFLAFFIPFIVLKVKAIKRKNLFEQQFPDTLDLLSSSLRSGHSLYGSFELISEEMPSPVSEVFKTAVDEISFGADVKDAILSLSKTMPDNMDLKFFITAIVIQREVGGNLVKILTTLSNTIRERFKMLGELKAKTAQSKLSGLMLSFVPPVICAVLFFMSPEYVKPLIETEQGHMVIIISISLILLAGLIIKRILTIEV